MSRYTIEFAVKEVDEDGETFGKEIFGASLSYAADDKYTMSELMEKLTDKGDSLCESSGDFITQRRPDDDEEDEDGVLADDELPSDIYDLWKNNKLDSERRFK